VLRGVSQGTTVHGHYTKENADIDPASPPERAQYKRLPRRERRANNQDQYQLLFFRPLLALESRTGVVLVLGLGLGQGAVADAAGAGWCWSAAISVTAITCPTGLFLTTACAIHVPNMHNMPNPERSFSHSSAYSSLELMGIPKARD